MFFKYFKYLGAHLVPAVVAFSLYMGGYYTFTALLFLFGFLPFVELFTTGTKENMDQAEEEMAKEDPIYDFIIYSLFPLQFIVFGFFLYQISDPNLYLHEIIGMITAYGMACGLAINTAHELGHRSSKVEQLISKSMLWTTLYMHFFIEHNRGHHMHVATEEDPGSSRYGENIYAFFWRSITTGWLSARTLERDRLQKAGQAIWNLQNEMLVYSIAQFLLVLSIAIFFGIHIMLYFLLASFIGILMLEAVNYIEHYGLSRKKKGRRYERTLPIHSWNSNHPLGRMVLLELSRHSDHHFIANRKYQLLRHFDESPQMPTGYPGMMLLALVPPLWFKVMHKQIDNYQDLFTAQESQDSQDFQPI